MVCRTTNFVEAICLNVTLKNVKIEVAIKNACLKVGGFPFSARSALIFKELFFVCTFCVGDLTHSIRFSSLDQANGQLARNISNCKLFLVHHDQASIFIYQFNFVCPFHIQTGMKGVTQLNPS